MFFYFYKFKPYIAVIGDIKNSKKIEERKAVQDKLNCVLNEVNNMYSSSIASRFVITLGDEFQGLLSSGENTMNIIQYIKKEVYPIKIRFGIGVGDISTDINSEIAIGADGPGYYRARESVDNIKSLERKKEKALYDVQIKIDERNELQELSLNSIFKLMYSIEGNWTEKQREVINYVLLEQENQTNTSLHFHVTQSYIQQVLAKSHYYAYKEAFDSVNKILNEVDNDK